MKNNRITYLYFLLFTCTTVVYSQSPIITKLNYYQLGQKYLRFTDYEPAVSIGSSGTDVIWDFSSMELDIQDTISCDLPNSTPFYSDYPNSNFSLKFDAIPTAPRDNKFVYYRIENDSLNLIAQEYDNGTHPAWFDSYSDYKTDLIFPFTYNDNYIDSFTRSYFDMSGSDWHYLTGSTQINVDGYGKLVTPDGDIIHNTLRVHQITHQRDSNHIFGINESVQSSYYWYSSNEQGPILQLDVNPSDNSVINGYYNKKHTDLVSITTSQKVNKFQIFPNPASSILTVSGLEGNSKLTFTNINGNQVYTLLSNLETSTINVSRWSKGVYFLTVTDDSVAVSKTKKIVITD